MRPNLSQLSQQNKNIFILFWPKYQLIRKLARKFYLWCKFYYLIIVQFKTIICMFLDSSHWELSENDPITLAWVRGSIRFKTYYNTKKLKIEIFQSLKKATDNVAFQKNILPKVYILLLKLFNFFREDLV